MKGLTKEWIKKAEKDFLVAKREFSMEPPEYDAVCFHSQQCVEKYMKAVLQENDVYFEKIHDLDVLLEKCKTSIPELLNLKKELVELSLFAVEIRYPGTEATVEEAKENLSVAEKVREIIKVYFKTNKPSERRKTVWKQ